MNYATIKNFDIANGLGVRVSLFVSGCRHHCPECFNAVAWDFNYGEPFTEEVKESLYEMLKPEYIDGLSLLGGEPFEIENQRALLPFVREVKRRYPEKNIWAYSGFLLDKELMSGRAHCEATDELLSYIDILVDGKFVVALKDISLKFRGSSNQRIIDVQKTLKNGEVVLVDSLMD
ncbi:MAG: anaerobic ribonucleoside-triphosphate reductase activating protein [Bacilli bacterium]|nr:anaerobic ribonucleoside-triphosphate reductase activating protein [Bacilli bacterium]